MKISRTPLATALAVLTGVALAAPVTLPAVAAADSGRTEAIVETAGDVQVSHVHLYAPLPKDAPAHPAACDKTSYVRYRLKDGPTDPQQADSVFVALPGAWGSGYSNDSLGRNTVRAGAAKGKKVEFWALERRAVCADDTTGLAAALKAKDYHVAFDYYYNHKPIDGKTFEGFKTDTQLAYLADFGMAQTVRDQYDVLTRELPNPTYRRTKTFCGGPSWAGTQEGIFAAWDFDGNPKTTDDAGYNQCAGFFPIDTVFTSDPVGLQASPLLKWATTLTSGKAYPEAVKAIKDGTLPRSFGFTGLLGPETLNLLGIVGVAAYTQPDQETELNKLIPRTPQWEGILRLLFSRTYSDFVTGANSIRDFRFTNAALLGTMTDNNAANLGILQTGQGAYTGGPVKEKTFPEPNQVAKLPGIGDLFGTIITGPNTRVGPTDKSKLYGWRNYDDVKGVPYTSPDHEVTDQRDLARQFGSGIADWEHYFPVRFIIDGAAAITGARTGDLANIVHADEAKKKPVLTQLAGDGALRGLLPLFAPKDYVTLPGYTHIDTISAAWKQNDGRPEKVSAHLVDFALRHLPR